MGRKKKAEDYKNVIISMHNNLYANDGKKYDEIKTIKEQLNRQLKVWADKVSIVVTCPGNEQNPWTFEELNIPVIPMARKTKSGYDQVGDYHVRILIDEADGLRPAKWVYLRTVVERKGGPQSKRSFLQFNWDHLVSKNYCIGLLVFLDKEHDITHFVSDDVHVIDYGNVIIEDNLSKVSLKLKNNNRTLVFTHGTNYPVEYPTRMVKGTRKVYKYVYGPGKGGANDLYGSLYGSTKLKSGTIRSHRARLHDEIDRFKRDDRFTKFWLYAECDRSDFMSYAPRFKGAELNEGFGANVASRKASIASISEQMGSPVNWCGSRAGAIDDFRNMIRQSIIQDYAYLLGLEYPVT